MTVLGDRDGKDTYAEAYTKGHGGIADPKIPDQFSGFLEAGLKALEHGSKIPKALIKACAGVCLLEAGEGSLVVSMQGGNGVALQHKDGKWSNPVAVNILSVGGGAVFGYANKCVIVLLNHFAMDRLLNGNGSIAIGVDAGFAVGIVLLNHFAMDRLLNGNGSIAIGVDAGFAVGEVGMNANHPPVITAAGRGASADIELSNKVGLGTSLIYTYSQGALFSVEAVIGGRINPPDAPNEKFYGTSSYTDILDGRVNPPEGSKITELLTKLNEWEHGPEAALSAEEMQIHVMSEEDVISHPFIISQVNVANSTISSWLAPQIWPLFCSNMNFAHLT
eukprot:CAMPEP_0202507482 /NCGR_PEP_ID=MMETSP1361-20130828/51748_1 /ASSEMBLY_ACC=CAM_ASM_000849 /TAXON_ID=210615 /ORGANISM="Staurosira complex sp., Strain CCMP2646" /LENGTH=333 /DNA_ID=CAMNT_0049141609 /DNA_START=1174 /DNA_END=2170 /DNA_ORIENTATION=-